MSRPFPVRGTAPRAIRTSVAPVLQCPATPPLRVRAPDPARAVGAGLASLLMPWADQVTLRQHGPSDVELVDGVTIVGESRPVDGAVPVVAVVRVGDVAARRRAHDLGITSVLDLDAGGAVLVAALVSAAHHGRAPRPLRLLTPSGEQLSRREAEVLAGICAGLSNVEIAHALFLSINSVKSYVRTAYRKMGVNRRPQAVLWGLEHGYGTS